jgi:hypothetical protein
VKAERPTLLYLVGLVSLIYKQNNVRVTICSPFDQPAPPHFGMLRSSSARVTRSDKIRHGSLVAETLMRLRSLVRYRREAHNWDIKVASKRARSPLTIRCMIVAEVFLDVFGFRKLSSHFRT